MCVWVGGGGGGAYIRNFTVSTPFNSYIRKVSSMGSGTPEVSFKLVFL